MRPAPQRLNGCAAPGGSVEHAVAGTCGREAVDGVGDDAVDAQARAAAAPRPGRSPCSTARACPAPCSRAITLGVHQRIGRHDRGAIAAQMASSNQPAARRVEQQRARQLRAPPRVRAASDGGSNELSSGGAASPCPQPRRLAARRRGRSRASSPGVGLISMLRAWPLRSTKRGDRFEARDRLAGEGAAVPAPGVEARQLAPGALAGDAARRRRALQRVVVEQERHAVGAELDVALEGAVAVARADAKRGQRVLRRQLAGAAVGDPQRVGPVVHDATRACVVASNQCSCSAATCSGSMSPAARRRQRAVDAHREERLAEAAVHQPLGAEHLDHVRPAAASRRLPLPPQSACSGRSPRISSPLRGAACGSGSVWPPIGEARTVGHGRAAGSSAASR